MNNTIILNKDIEVLIVSAGGVGTTFLMDAIGKYKSINQSSNSDGYKHLPIPPISQNPNLKVVYVFGNPVMASISLFRRKYHAVQSIKSQQYLDEGFTISEEMSLAEYASNGEDGHYFERHLNNWETNYRVYPTLFLRYETLFEQLEALALFLDLPAEFVSNFPAKRKRLSDKDALSPSTQEGLDAMYATLAAQMKALPDVFIQEATESIRSLLLRPPYKKALSKVFWKKMPLLRKLKNKITTQASSY